MILGLAVVLARPAQAQALHDGVWIEGSLYRPHIGSMATVTSKADQAIGTEIELEEDLGLKSRRDLPAVLAGVRISRKLAVVGEYFRIGREGQRSIAEPITFNGATYAVDASVKSRFDADIYKLTLNYSIVRGDTIEAGVALGVNATKFAIALEGVGNAEGRVERRAEDFLAPLPTVGLFANYEIAPRLTVGVRADCLALRISHYDVRLVSLQGRVSYRLVKNVGIGLGYRHVDYRIDVDNDRYAGRFKYSLKGPAIYLEAGF